MKKHVYPCLMVIVALALLAGCVFVLRLLTGGTLMAEPQTHAQTAAIVWLDEYTVTELAALPDTDAQKEALAQIMDNLGTFGANAVALTGRTARAGEAVEDGIFRDETQTVPISADVKAKDGWFKKADLFALLVDAAHRVGIEVLLIPTDTKGALWGVPSVDDAVNAPQFATQLAQTYALRTLTPVGEAATPGTKMGQYVLDDADTRAVVLRDDTSAIALADALRTAGYAQSHYIMGEYSTLCADGGEQAFLRAAFTAQSDAPDISAAKGERAVVQTLGVSYPVSDGESVTTSAVFLMGTSAPELPLTIDGAELVRYGTRGVWGVLLPLSYGENTFTLANGAESMTYTLVRKKASSGGSNGTSLAGQIVALPEGQRTEIIDDIASALSNAFDSSSYQATLYKGAQAQVTSYTTNRYGDAYAYRLTTGDYVYASDCALLPPGTPAFNTATLTQTAQGDDAIVFDGACAAAYHTWDEPNTLVLRYLDVSFSGVLPQSDWFTATYEQVGNDVLVTLQFPDAQPLYGWAVVYHAAAKTTTLTLKRAPQLSDDPTAPLRDVVVLLDAGHGLDDEGAMGAAGMHAPTEKDLNLALTFATKYRLEQLGATVTLSRADDSYPTLGDRVTMLNETQPDFFLSIHHNSIALSNDVNTATGVEAYWFYPQSAAFAARIVDAVSDVTARKNRGAFEGYFYVTRSGICPAILLETGFMTNPAEYEDLENDETIWREAGAIAQAIYEQVKTHG